jgi:hypothetical protein
MTRTPDRCFAVSRVRYHAACGPAPLKRGAVEPPEHMSEHLPEQDWKRWQKLAPTLLNRFCDSVVENAAGFATGEASGHDKFLALYRFLGESNDDIAVVFDNRRRSSALFQIAAAVVRGIMSESELKSLSGETQERVRRIVAIGS